MSSVKLVLMLAARHLRARPGLHAIAIMGVLIGVFALVLMDAIMRGIRTRFQDQLVSTSAHIILRPSRLSALQSVVSAQMETPGVVLVRHEAPRHQDSRLLRGQDLVNAVAASPGVSAAC